MAVEKQQRKRKTERKWKANEETGSRLRELGDQYLLIKFVCLSIFKML